MRAFVSPRGMLASNDALARKLTDLERRLEGHNQAIKSLFDAIRQLAAPPAKPRREIGFHVKEGSAPYRVKGNPAGWKPPVAASPRCVGSVDTVFVQVKMIGLRTIFLTPFS
ncbi:MAG: hypothetical protein HY674_12085 [Chloroflexi bacterium]|nr:hypothetical protein [Chloroflexota bacterium]